MENKLSKQLIELGYKKHISDSYKMFHSTNVLYQKRVDDDKGIRYYINSWYYPDGHSHEEGIQIDVQLYGVENKVIMNVTMFEQDPRNAEMYLQYMWETLKLGYYELY